MDQKILDKTAKVIVVDGSAPSRQLLSETLKTLGYENIQGLGSVKDVINFFETDDADWIICPLEKDVEENALSLLKLITLNAPIGHVRVSLLYDDEEVEFLPSAFELGLLSCHSKSFTKDSIKADFEDLLKTFEKKEGHSPLIAAHFFRIVLEDAKLFEDWVKLEQGLLDIYAGKSELLMNIATPYHELGKDQEALLKLKQAKFVDPNCVEAVDQLIEELGLETAEGSDENEQTEATNLLGIDHIVVVDPDSAIQSTLLEVLAELGVPKVECFEDGEAAAEYIIQNKDIGLIIQEWKIPKIPGPIFVQKVVNGGHASTPIIVISSLVQVDDMPLIKELGVASIISKPLNNTQIVEAILWTVQQDRSPSERGAMEAKIHKLLKANNRDEVSPLISKFLADDLVPNSRKKLIEAEWAYFNSNYQEARDAAISAIKTKGDSILLLNILGKALMKLGDYDAALKCFEKAKDLSPDNIERLCNIAESHAELGNTEEASATLDGAKELDPDSDLVEQAEVKVAMASDDTEKAAELMANLESLDGIVGYMNNKAVALSRCDKFEDGIQQYKNTIKALPKNSSKLRAKVYYNLALAYARASELDDAKVQLESIRKEADKTLMPKVKSLLKRINSALDEGSDFKLLIEGPNPAANKNASPEETEKETKAQSASNLQKVFELLPTKGEIGCYLSFQLSTAHKASETLLAVLPRFTPRDSIERDETGKGEKALKSAS